MTAFIVLCVVVVIVWLIKQDPKSLLGISYEIEYGKSPEEIKRIMTSPASANASRTESPFGNKMAQLLNKS